MLLQRCTNFVSFTFSSAIQMDRKDFKAELFINLNKVIPRYSLDGGKKEFVVENRVMVRSAL